MPENAIPATSAADGLYGAEYYHSHCGDVPYTADSAVWQDFYGRVADEIVRSFTPKRVFDAGCAIGFLIAALWDRNVEAHGRDISSYAISQVRPDVREFCSVDSIAAPIEGLYDLVLCIEVLEHMSEDDALAAIAVLAKAAPRILFSSTPLDFDEPTHVNVRPTLYWLRHFADAGMAPSPLYDASFLCPHAMLLERAPSPPTERDLIAFAEIIRQRLARASEARLSADLSSKLSGLHSILASEQAARAAAEADWQARLSTAERRASAAVADRARIVALLRPLVWQRGASRALRRGGRVLWWAATLQLPERLRDRRERMVAEQSSGPRPEATDPLHPKLISAHDSLARRFPALTPLRTYPGPSVGRRVSLVTDSVSEGSLYGGVGTAIILAALLAERTGAQLRLITRTEEADARRVKGVIDAHGLDWSGELDIVHAPPEHAVDVSTADGDIFLTTSWWTTQAVMQSVRRRQVVYLLQEDERMFYARGDDHLRCSETLATDGLNVLINSELLFQHLTHGRDPVVGLADRAHWFEPAFPTRLFYDNSARTTARTKRRFLFYARPGNSRNLYWRGLEVISSAIEEGILDPADWLFTFVGRDLSPVALPHDVVPELRENLPWERYADLIRNVDVGLSLMDTPHASYPPLDLAASGAVVVTNVCGVKQDLARYSNNIISVQPGVDELRDGVARAVAMARDDQTRQRNYANSTFNRDWRVALETTLAHCVKLIEE